MSLCTFRDVPWNGPYYRSLGFREVAEADLAPYEARLREQERELRPGRERRAVVMRSHSGEHPLTGQLGSAA